MDKAHKSRFHYSTSSKHRKHLQSVGPVEFGASSDFSQVSQPNGDSTLSKGPHEYVIIPEGQTSLDRLASRIESHVTSQIAGLENRFRRGISVDIEDLRSEIKAVHELIRELRQSDYRSTSRNPAAAHSRSDVSGNGFHTHPGAKLMASPVESVDTSQPPLMLPDSALALAVSRIAARRQTTSLRQSNSGEGGSGEEARDSELTITLPER